MKIGNKTKTSVIAVNRLAVTLKKDRREVKAGNVKKQLAKGVLAIALISFVSCSGTHGSIGKSETGFFTLTGDAEGIKAFGDVANGLVTTGKSAPNVVDSYWQHRGEQLRFKVIKPQGAINNGK